MFAGHMMAGGMSANLVRGLLGQVSPSLTSAGTTQTDAYAMQRATVQVFTTVAANSGAILPTGMEPGESLLVYNSGAESLSIYPPVGGTINELAVNTALTVTA